MLPTEKRYLETSQRLEALRPQYTRAKKALESGEAAEMKLIAFDRIAELVRRAPGSDHSMLLGQIAEAVERVTEPERVVRAFEQMRERAKTAIASVVVDDDPTPSN